MGGFTKLWSEIVASSIWSEDDKTRIVWITLLAMSDAAGHVRAALPGLADLSRVSFEDCKRAVQILESPDAYSRDKEHDGRRITPEPGGWLILNYSKFRARTGRELSDDPRRAYQREWMRRKRQQQTAAGESVNICQRSASVSTYNKATKSEDKRNSKTDTWNEAWSGVAEERLARQQAADQQTPPAAPTA